MPMDSASTESTKAWRFGTSMSELDSVMIRLRREENWATLSPWELVESSMELREARTSGFAPEQDMVGSGTAASVFGRWMWLRVQKMVVYDSVLDA